MTIINAFSMSDYAVALKRKTVREVTKALQPILAANSMTYLWTENRKGSRTV